MEKKNKVYIIISIIVVILTAALAVTFAFIGGPTVVGNTNVVTSIPTGLNNIAFTYSGDNTITLNIALDNLTPSAANNNYSSYIDSNTAIVNVTFSVSSANYTNGATCHYSILYTPTTAYTASAASVSNSLNELVIVGTSSVANFTTSVAGSSPVTLVDNTSIVASSGNDSTTHSWTFKMRFYNLNIDQSSALGQTPTGTLSIVPGECSALTGTTQALNLDFSPTITGGSVTSTVTDVQEAIDELYDKFN